MPPACSDPRAQLDGGERSRRLAHSEQGISCRSECRKDAAREGKALLNDLGYWVSRAGQGRETLQWEELNFLLFLSLSLSLLELAGISFKGKKGGKKKKETSTNKDLFIAPGPVLVL